MKRLLLLSTIVSLFYFTQAQTPSAGSGGSDENTLRLGLHFTPTINYIKSDKPAIKNGGAVLGYNWGLVFDIKFADNYFFSTGINIVNTRIKLNFVDVLMDTSPTSSFSLNDVDLKFKNQFIGIPISLKLKTKEVNYLRYYGMFGAEPQFNISKKVHANKGRYAGNEFFSPSETAYSNFNDDVAFIRMAVVVGLGVEYSLGGKTALVFGATYNGGFTDMNKDKGSKVTNSYVAINIGVLF